MNFPRSKLGQIRVKRSFFEIENHYNAPTLLTILGYSVAKIKKKMIAPNFLLVFFMKTKFRKNLCISDLLRNFVA